MYIAKIHRIPANAVTVPGVVLKSLSLGAPPRSQNTPYTGKCAHGPRIGIEVVISGGASMYCDVQGQSITVIPKVLCNLSAQSLAHVPEFGGKCV